ARLLQGKNRLSLLGLQSAAISDDGAPLGLEPLPGLGQLIDIGLEDLLAAHKLLALLLQLGPARIEVAVEGGELLLTLQSLALDLQPPGFNLGAGRLVATGLLVKGPLSLR